MTPQVLITPVDSPSHPVNCPLISPQPASDYLNTNMTPLTVISSQNSRNSQHLNLTKCPFTGASPTSSPPPPCDSSAVPTETDHLSANSDGALSSLEPPLSHTALDLLHLTLSSSSSVSQVDEDDAKVVSLMTSWSIVSYRSLASVAIGAALFTFTFPSYLLLRVIALCFFFFFTSLIILTHLHNSPLLVRHIKERLPVASSSLLAVLTTKIIKMLESNRENERKYRASIQMVKSPRKGGAIFPGVYYLAVSLFTLMVFTSFNSRPCEAKVKITSINVPKFVENGTSSLVVLDCPFTLDPGTDHNLVVKWFFNDDPEPIYQWIIEYDGRYVHDSYESRVNPNYTVPNTADPRQKHRALNLIRPTVEMNGRYSCHVISIMSQDSADASMTVYVKPKSIQLSTRRVVQERSTALQQTNFQPGFSLPHHHNRPQSDSAALYDALETQQSASVAAAGGSGAHGSLASPTTAEIKCTVQNVFPMPEINIYQVIKDGGLLKPKSLEKARFNDSFVRLPNGAFNKTVIAYIEDTQLLQGNHNEAGNTILECLVTQDEIRHQLRERTWYNPVPDPYYYSSSTWKAHGILSAWTLLLLNLVLLMLTYRYF